MTKKKLHCKLEYDNSGILSFGISADSAYVQGQIKTDLSEVLRGFMEVYHIPSYEFRMDYDIPPKYYLLDKCIHPSKIEISGTEPIEKIAEKIKELYERFWEIIQNLPNKDKSIEFEL